MLGIDPYYTGMTEPQNGIVFQPIGVIHTPFKTAEGTPIQPRRAEGARGVVEVYPEYREGLADLSGFSHVVLIYHCHMCRGYELKVIPYLDTQLRGLFATRAPRRPNPIGLSIVQLDSVEPTGLKVSGVDIIDGTPLLDIKPYVPEFDHMPDCRVGWLSEVVKDSRDKSADDRFHK